MHLQFSQDLEVLLKRLASRPLAIAEILDKTAERGFSLLLALFVFPFLFPMPPGSATILGLGSFLLAMQMALGLNKPWLPRKIVRFKFPQSLARNLLKNVRFLTRFLDKITRPRWLSVAKNPYIWRINGLCLAGLSILLMLPIPFTNPLPTVPMLLLAVATLEMDGLLMCISYLLSFLVALFFGFIGYAILQAPHLLPTILR
jgi:hypothetical protein